MATQDEKNTEFVTKAKALMNEAYELLRNVRTTCCNIQEAQVNIGFAQDELIAFEMWKDERDRAFGEHRDYCQGPNRALCLVCKEVQHCPKVSQRLLLDWETEIEFGDGPIEPDRLALRDSELEDYKPDDAETDTGLFD
jgi:hypothetical protein